jgi:prepilin-type N-terminal cleavage/methylation domain-containing protein
MRANEKGFTIIELTIVLALIAIFAAVFFVSLGNTRQDARDTQRIGDMQTILGAQNSYYSHNDYFFTDDGSGGIPDISGYLTGPSDQGGGTYIWKNNTGCDPDGEYFCAYATLEVSDECDYDTYVAVSEKGIERICETSDGAGFLGTGCSCW